MKERSGAERVLMDSAADTELVYKVAYDSGIDFLTPPKKNVKKRKKPWLQGRTWRLLEILDLGDDMQAKSIWGKLAGYSKKATIKSAIARWKQLFSGYLGSRCKRSQRFEVCIKYLIINEIKNLENVQFKQA